MATASKPLLLVISQVYVPDPASVGQHIADVSETLVSRGHDVRVLTSSRGYEDPLTKYPARERRAGVEVFRLPLSSFGKKSVVHRLFGQMLFLAQVIIRGMFARHLSGVLVSTSPPMAAFAALVIASVRRVPITYWVMDLNPDQAIALGKVSTRSPLVTAMKWLNRRIFARAAAVVVLDRFMAERIERQYVVRGRLEVLPPWPHVGAACRAADQGVGCRVPGASTKSDTRHPTPDTYGRRPPPLGGPTATANPFVAEHQLAGRFVVMYSGNHSPANPVTTLLEAALALQEDPRFVFVFIGGGLGKRQVEEAIQTHRTANILSLPYQPLEQIQYSLSAADLHVVTLGTEMVGIIHPCKIYGAMAVGRPVLFIGPRPSHAADLIERHKIGWHVNQNDVAAAVASLRAIADAPPAVLAEMGERASQAACEYFHKDRLCPALCEVIERAAVPENSYESVRHSTTLDRLEPVTSDAP
jgi:glycosyltransferase involved in cell wall biosynthesis